MRMRRIDYDDGDDEGEDEDGVDDHDGEVDDHRF